jgi:hypothetical protein
MYDELLNPAPSLEDYALDRARVVDNLAALLDGQADRPHVGDEMTSRVKVLRLRADLQREFAATYRAEADALLAHWRRVQGDA